MPYYRLPKQELKKVATTSWASDINANFTYLWTDRPNVRVYKSTGTNVSHASPPLPLSFNVVRYNVGGCWSGASPSALTAPRDGLYLVFASVGFPANAVGNRSVVIDTPDGPLTFGEVPANGTGECTVTTSAIVYLTNGQQVFLSVYQNSTSTLTLEPSTATHYVGQEFGMTWIGGTEL